MSYQSYREYSEIQDLYVLHEYYVGGSQGDENSLGEIITSGNDIEALKQLGEQMYPIGTRHGWNWYEYIIMTNTATEAGRVLHEAQKATWKQQWEHIDNNPEQYKGAAIVGSRDEGPIAVWMQHNPELDNPQGHVEGMKTSSYTYMIYDVSVPPQDTESTTA